MTSAFLLVYTLYCSPLFQLKKKKTNKQNREPIRKQQFVFELILISLAKSLLIIRFSSHKLNSIIEKCLNIYLIKLILFW